jgi:hypothetical protein
MLFLLSQYLFGIRYAELTCNRDGQGIECELVHHTLLFNSSEIKIHNPIAVDIEDYARKRYSSGPSSLQTTAKIRSKDTSHQVYFYSGYDYQAVKKVASQVNEFLLASDASYFHEKFYNTSLPLFGG